MALPKAQLRALRPPIFLQRAGIALQKPRHLGIISTRSQVGSSHHLPQTVPPRRPFSSSIHPKNRQDPQEDKRSSPEAISSVLHDADPSSNSLLSAVHIPYDPDGVLTKKHPAASILANSAIVVTRQFELMNIMVGFEQANKYVIMDPQGQHIGFMAETDLGMGNMLKRQMFNTHRSFTTHVFDKHGKEVLRFHRPFSWISSRIGIYDTLQPGESTFSTSTDISPVTSGGLTTNINQDAARISPLPLSEMRIIGEAQQQWAPLRRKYNLFVHRDSHEPSAPQLTSGDIPLSNSTALQPSSSAAAQSGGEFGQFAYVDEPFLSWDFSLLTSDSKLLGSVNRNFAGFGREIFTDTGVYALRMDAASLTQEPSHMISKTGQKSQPAEGPGMTLDQRAVMLATAVSVDFDYFSRKSGGSGMMGGLWPVWLPGGGEAAGVEAGAEGAVVEGAGQGSAGTSIESGAEKAGGAATGAGTVAGYEAMQRGAHENDASISGQEQNRDYGIGQDFNSPPNQHSRQEDVLGNEENPWDQNRESGADDDGDGGWVDSLKDFFDDV